MHPELIHLKLPIVGEFTLYSFGAMMALAFLAGYLVLRSEFRRREQNVELASDILLGALVGGIVGAKLYYLILHFDRTAADPLGMILSRGGLVWYGGFVGGVVGSILALRRRRASVALAADVCAPALALAYGIGRIGCFLVGDDYGRTTGSWVGVSFPNGIPPSTAGNLRAFGVDVPDAVPDAQVLAVHPTQLYETGLALLIFLFLWRIRKNRHGPGWLFGVWMMLAGAERLFVEIFRAKDDRFLGTFTLAQAISVGLILVGFYILHRRAAGRGAEADA
ncbi:MAG: prolipoprotein diacylglyceryl transferase [Gemmatimonadota bacterium]